MQIFEELVQWLSTHWVTIIVIFHISLSFITSIHVLLFKENERTSLAWIGLVILSPVIGSLFYWLFGINRIQRLAQKKHPPTLKQDFCSTEKTIKFHQLPKNWHSAIIAAHTIHPVNYLANNSVEPLINGDTAYPTMIQSIDDAKNYIVLSSYIFAYDSLGRQFVNALARAHQRGVTVNVLLDGIGIGYSWQKVDRALKKMGVKTARFLPAISLTSFRFINLRNHRKTLCIDGEVAYMGGINISKNNIIKAAIHPIDDIHFKVTGPVIDQISQVFIEDWFFATGEHINFPYWQSNTAEQKNSHSVIARVIQDGPDEHHNRVRWTLINALVCANKSVKIMTPYFIPDQTLMTSLHAAALRGVSIEIIVPEHSDITFVDWVMAANFSRIIKHGIKIYQNQRPFDHSKIVIIDDIWSFIGSSNWDARSLELNFEINLECYDVNLNAKLTAFFALKKQNTTPVIASEFNNLPIYKKIRNNLFRLFSPYL
ncbi:cardiolipin synthase [Colwellia sp. MB02u-18]|uniref:cardiolipin synthase n=1 Tax=unclassified Colwellia TaxID=196834 RepID=UPI0015F7181D|nr:MULTISPECIES: cardiolipin synthase [unclassified Colwellia]MBA6224798.1 cardiolipin synthase [Colwellia sp. MB3u-45]MBA6268914.1 cardiolipin synthase [Colwellia sp. MB3u-43]MBA6321345.1 cardiolipin synthase [Colwellia sp. MB02u-19]MBA6325898.1 cardiolipin synthase [Colwellia sp. MB02u-18]MBA6332373.1 cardiolipin synthase [Colwellia sp. MB02u-12]